MSNALHSAEGQPSVGIARFLLDDFLVLLNSLLEHVLVDTALLRIADHPGVNASENAAGIRVFRVLFEVLFSLEHSFAQLAGLDVEVGQFLTEDGDRGVLFHGQAVVLDGLGDKVTLVPVGSGELRVDVAEGVMIVSACLVLFYGRRLGVHYRESSNSSQR